MTSKKTWKSLARALRGLCPACGRTGIFERAYQLAETCSHCGLALRSRDPNTWFFMYGSTAAITGGFLVLMFALRPWVSPQILRVGLTVAALLTFLLTLRLRKSLAVAIDYLV